MYSGDAGKTGIFPESLLMFCHIVVVQHSPPAPFKAAFSTDPSSTDWTSGLDPMENSPTNQPNTHTQKHTKFQGVLFND